MALAVDRLLALGRSSQATNAASRNICIKLVLTFLAKESLKQTTHAAAATAHFFLLGFGWDRSSLGGVGTRLSLCLDLAMGSFTLAGT